MGGGPVLKAPQPQQPRRPTITQSPRTMIQVTINGILYLVDQRPVAGGSVQIQDHVPSQPDTSLSPATILNVKGTLIDGEWLKAEIGRMDSNDDVFNLGFTTLVLFTSGEGSFDITPDGEQYLRSLGASWSTSLVSAGQIPSGPYIRTIHMALWSHLQSVEVVCRPQWRLHTTSDPDLKYDPFPFDLIPVPSRLYFDPPTAEKPLSGLRLAIKDIYDLKGVRTGCSVRDFLCLYPPANESAVSIQKLVNYGAVPIGKTKTTQFASGEGTMDWVDYQCSFNPRGDRYQATSMSSVGSAAGLASYDWIDSSLGTDTFGSILWPAASQGLFGLRPTHKILDNSGVLRLSEHLDTVGHFSRSVDDFFTLGQAWFKGTAQHPFQLPKTILFPTQFWEPYQTEWFSPIVEKFIQDLERVLGTQRIMHDIETDWASTTLPPCDIPLKEYLATTLSTIQLYDCYHNNAKFRNDFETANGHSPYVNPMIRFKWNLGARLSKECYEDALERKRIFNDFLSSNVFKPDTIMLLPLGSPSPIYRDTYRGSPEETGKRMQGFGFGSVSFTALGGLPQVAFPIGQYSYKSSITNQDEVLPVVISIVGAKHTDLSIIKIIKHALEETQRPTAVSTGKVTFPDLVGV
ncbi:amidase signature enzyme [Cadophora sp. DSE1049]|nr:amidase signature enzyme [Cadophora sp. DSE1049]